MVKKIDAEINKRTKQALIFHMIVSFTLAILVIRIFTSFDTTHGNLTWWEIFFICVWFLIYISNIKYFMLLFNMFSISFIMHLIEGTWVRGEKLSKFYLCTTLITIIMYNYYTIHFYISKEYEFPSSPFEYIIGYDSDKGIGIRDGYFE